MPAQKSKDLAGDGSEEEKRDYEEVKEEEEVGTNGEVKNEEGTGGEVQEKKEEEEEERKVLPEEMVMDLPVKQDDSDAEGNSQSSESAGDHDEFVLVKLAEIRKEVQCPICLGIIRKTRTVMECLHRFCRDCIDKSMRLSNNECPACRTHCASRRSLRDDPNFDSLISALYPDIDKYEEEELAFSEEERSRNKKIQESIAETFKRQTEAWGKRKLLYGSRARNPRRRSRGRGRPIGGGIVISTEEEDEINGGSNRESESDDADVSRPVKRARRKSVVGNSEEEQNGDSPMTGGSSASPSKTSKDKEKDSSPLKSGNKEQLTGVSSSSPLKGTNKEQLTGVSSSPSKLTNKEQLTGVGSSLPLKGTNKEQLAGVGSSTSKGTNKELTGVSLSPLKGGNMEVLSWGKNGARSQNRTGPAGRVVKGSRVAKLIEHLRSLDASSSNNEGEILHVSLVALDGLEMMYVCCKESLSVRQICKLVAVKLKEKAEDIEIYAKRHQVESCMIDETKLEILRPDTCILELGASFSAQGDLQLIYGVKGHKVLERR